VIRFDHDVVFDGFDRENARASEQLRQHAALVGREVLNHDERSAVDGGASQ
jgi:hypothetical protein